MSPDIIVACITAGFAFVTAVVVALIRRRYEVEDDILSGVEATKEQVQNSHKTNLRDDLDSMHETSRHILRLVEDLYEQILLERRERMALSERLDDHANGCPIKWGREDS